MAATNKCLAQNNKSRMRGSSTAVAGTDTFEVLSISSNGVANLYRYTKEKT
jgi:hypothetical protein